MVKLLNKNGDNLFSQNIYNDTYVHGAVARNKLGIFEFLIANNVSVSLSNNAGQTPLHVAALHDNVEIIDKLLLKGVSVNDKTVHGKTPLHVAVSNKIDQRKAKMNEETIKRLLNANSKIDSQDNSNTTILLESLLQKKVATAKMLLDKGANVNTANDAGWTALHEAAKIADAKLVKSLLGKNAQINAKDKNGQTPVHVLIKASGQLSTVKLLLQKGANVKTRDNSGASLLLDAAIANRLDVAKELIKRRVDINAPNNEGSTPLHEAAKLSTVNLLSYLIFVAESDVRNAKGQTPFQVAICANGNMDKLMYFVGKGVNVLTTDNSGSTLLHDAARCGNSEIVQLLILKGLALNTLDKHGLTPLHLAAEHENLEVIDFLLISSAQIDLIDPSGSTALHKAAFKSYLEIVETLIQNGANVDLKNSEGKKAVDLALERKQFQVAKFLIVQKGSIVESTSRETRSIRSGKMINRKVRNVDVTKNLDLTLQPTVTNSASKTTSWINVFVSSAFDAFKSVSGHIFSENCYSLPKSTYSKLQSNFVTKSTDVNSSLLLIDVAVRKLTGQRYIYHEVQPIPLKDVRSIALSITEKFENILIDLAGIWKFDQTNFNSFELYKSIEMLVISEKYSEIQGKLLSTVKTVYPHFMQNEIFVKALEKNIESIFESD